jgi:membrane protease YdiL (CAAX protease family)
MVDDLSSYEESPEEPQSVPERSTLEILFFTAEERRLRAGWRLFIQSLVLGFFILGVQFIVRYYLYANFPSLMNYNFYISSGIYLVGITGSVFAARVILDDRSFRSLGLFLDAEAGRDFGIGLGISFLMAGFLFLSFWAVGWLDIQGFAWNVDVPDRFILFWVIFLILFLAVAWQEELLFRGYWLRNVRDGLNAYWAVGLSALVSSVFHFFNPNISWKALVALILMGLFYGYALISSRRLWLPMGLHFGWAFFRGSIFGFRVTGLRGPRLLIHQETGPAIWTGGLFGPEEGLLLLPTLVLGVFFVWVYTSTRE